MEFKALTEFLSIFLNGTGVFVISVVIGLVFGFIYLSTKSRQLLNSLPGLFTSLGLLGTFVAICNSLGEISEDSLQVDKIITDLIPAFTSSIAGLISAFLVTMACKIFYSYEDSRLDEKLNKKTPEECLFTISTESEISNNQLKDILYQLEEQNKKSKEYNEKLNSTISQQSLILERFINDFVERMDDIFNKMHHHIERQIQEFGEDQFKKSSNLLYNITEKLSSVSEDLLNEQKVSVKQMISETNEELSKVSDNVTVLMGQLCEQTTIALNSLGSKQSQEFTAIINNYNELASKLSDQNSVFAEKMNSQMNEEFEKIKNQSIKNLDMMLDLKDAYIEVNTGILENTTKMNKDISDELRCSLNDLVLEFRNTLGREVNTLSNVLVKNVETLENSYSYISDHVAHIKGNYENAAQAFEDAMIHTHRMNESQEKMLATINHSMNSVVTTNEKVDVAISILDGRQEKIENLIVHINEIGTTIEILQKLEGQLNRIVNR